MTLNKTFVQFFKELEQNNNRDWFNDNKNRFIQDVKEPFESLTADVIGRMQKLDKEVTVTPKECVFRIYRDTRFSKDKTPYKTHMAAIVGRGGRKNLSHPGIYYQINAKGITIGGGIYQPSKERLYRIREKIAADPKAFRKIVDSKVFKNTFGKLESEQNKRIPKEFIEAGEMVPEIYNKSFHFWVPYNGQKYVLQKDLDKFIFDHYKKADKYNDFLIATA